MSKLSRLNPFSFLLRKLVDFALSLLTKPVARYTLAAPNDMEQLQRGMRKGDVLLVEGNERISECIKYLTQSSWSHSAIYVGDEPLKRDPELKRELVEKFGDDANYLLVEALVESGVVLTPLSKYRNFNIRICRPHRLAAADQREVVDFALSHVGLKYDLKNIFDLARYFLPVSIVPARWRRQALHFGSGNPTQVICSSLIAESFHRVRYPVVPRYEPFPPGFAPVKLVAGFLGRFSGSGRPLPGLLRMVSPTLITPRDFDLSPYFEIIKFDVLGGSKFDYRKLLWAEEAKPEAEELEKSA
ncbi:MAG TPA: YiiX/YebB-like N1pC/P60 family cysteine hydrolase [Candidatus Binataceae bacterium]|nr:YiiX/YebB-like N1pC/P60 family cysteine hydrolase [Candidatus Binataceae bacterium]